MSLIPDHYICLHCGGYDLPASCFTLSSSCRCWEEAEAEQWAEVRGDPLLKSIDLDDDGGRVAA